MAAKVVAEEGEALFWIDWIGSEEKLAMRLCLECYFNFVVVVLRQSLTVCLLMIRLHQPPECWDYKYVPSCLVGVIVNLR